MIIWNYPTGEGELFAVKSLKSEKFLEEDVESWKFHQTTVKYSEVLFDWLVVTKDDEQTVELLKKVQGF